MSMYKVHSRDGGVKSTLFLACSQTRRLRDRAIPRAAFLCLSFHTLLSTGSKLACTFYSVPRTSDSESVFISSYAAMPDPCSVLLAPSTVN